MGKDSCERDFIVSTSVIIMPVTFVCHHFAIILFTDAEVSMALIQRLAAACRPAKYPVAQAHWKLKPPIRPSQSRISPTR